MLTITSSTLVSIFCNITAEPEQILIIRLPNLRALCRTYSSSLILPPRCKIPNYSSTSRQMYSANPRGIMVWSRYLISAGTSYLKVSVSATKTTSNMKLLTYSCHAHGWLTAELKCD